MIFGKRPYAPVILFLRQLPLMEQPRQKRLLKQAAKCGVIPDFGSLRRPDRNELHIRLPAHGSAPFPQYQNTSRKKRLVFSMPIGLDGMYELEGKAGWGFRADQYEISLSKTYFHGTCSQSQTPFTER